MKIIKTCKDCGFFRITKSTNYLFGGATICAYQSKVLYEPYMIPDWCHLPDRCHLKALPVGEITNPDVQKALAGAWFDIQASKNGLWLHCPPIDGDQCSFNLLMPDRNREKQLLTQLWQKLYNQKDRRERENDNV